jgi:hypothetical protein
LFEVPPLQVIESGEALTLVLVVYDAAAHVGAVSPVVNDELEAESPFVNPE